jgi:hypothetical protein
MSAADTWTITELMQHAQDYGSACTRRNRKLIVISVGLLALAFLSIPISPKLIAIPISGLIALAAYVVFTCRRWHRLHGVFCPHCQKSLIEVNDQLEEIFFGAPATDSLVCPHCGGIIAKP